MTAALPIGDVIPVERVLLRRIGPSLAFADVRIPGVNLHDLRIEQRDDGALIVSPPVRTDQHGRAWRSYDLQPGTREAVEAEIRRLWERSR